VSWVITIILNYLFDVPFYQLEIKFVFFRFIETQTSNYIQKQIL